MNTYQVWDGNGMTLIRKDVYDQYTEEQKDVVVGTYRTLQAQYVVGSFEEAWKAASRSFGWKEDNPVKVLNT